MVIKLTLALFVLLVGVVCAADDPPDWFRKLDRNGDGKITREEMPKLFELIDVDHDGVATLAEVSDYFARHPPQAAVPLPTDVAKEAVIVWSDGTRMAGDLYLPKKLPTDRKLPGILVCAGTAGTKTGSNARIAIALAEHGYAALAFDYRGWGESDPRLMAVDQVPPPDEKGEVLVKARAIRWQMDFADQAMDIRAALSFLAGDPRVDADRLGLWGSSYGGTLVTWTAGNDPRVKCTAAQVPGFGGPRTPEAISRTFEYLAKQTRGEVEPVPFETGKLSGKMARYTQMRVNPTKAIGFDVADAAEKIAKPILFVVAEKEELSDNAKTKSAADSLRSRGVPAEYHVIPGITHYGIYAEGYDEATNLEIAWFDQHLKAGSGPAR